MSMSTERRTAPALTASVAAPVSKGTYRRLLGYAAPYWRTFMVSAIAMMIYASLGPAFAKLIQPLIDGSFVNNDPSVLRMAPFILIGLSIVRGVAGFCGDYYSGWVSRRVITDLRRDMFDQFLNLPCATYDRSSSGQFMSQLLFNTEQVAESLTNGLMGIFRDGLTIIGLVALMVYENLQLSLVLLVVGPLLGVGISWVSKRFRRISRRIQESMGSVGHVAQEAIDAQRIVKVFNGKSYEADKFHQENELNFRRYLKRIATEAASGSVIQLIYIGGFAAVLYVVSLDSVRGTITPGSLISFIAAMSMLLSPIKRVANLTNVVQRGIAAGGSIFELLDSAREQDSGTVVLRDIEGRVEYQGVSLAYQDDGDTVLHAVDLVIQPGKTIALVGHSGSGKTSLIRLLPRLYEPSAGRILIDGYDIRDLTLHSLRRHIAYVGQEVTLFNDTIANNIAYGSRETATPEQIRQAAAAAHALSFIENMPEGFATMVGEQGIILSGGQRQRIAIARALLKNAPILILDEATSALDAESERSVQEALENLMQNRTTLVIAHRLSTIQNADQIYVMQDGEIIEQGTHESLLQVPSQYGELYRLQFGQSAQEPQPEPDSGS
ncbi:MAG: lipid A export permease/ATP-binding protein MsbA [Methylococcaceae bacterium]|nr:lipid A export permease/ATP-binding protein MsbA [Methylococcaceae bacterium]